MNPFEKPKKNVLKLQAKSLMCLPHSDDFLHALARDFVLAGRKVFPLFLWITYSGGFYSPMRTKYTNTSNSHYCSEGEQREILLAVYARFCRFSKGAFCRKFPISTRRNDRLKSGKLLNLIWHIEDKIRQLSTSLDQSDSIFREQDFFKRRAFLLTHPVLSKSCHIP